ncbi:probable inactive tRNA-specific adenosine deaminase-like protein 3 [Trichomycterus rosablanca]|uniref:probable inactive tRNA-specific adenosine deaminase-like protein 3 n=1 Tax=Trichomycterus rosablanca TaxID=2290929 RepID=UPI002F34F0AA
MEPETKKRKGMEHDPDSWEVLPVLSDEKSQDVKLVDAYAAPITQKKETSRLVRDLSAVYPLPDLQHIKRVRACKEKSGPHPLEVILCLVTDVPEIKNKPPTLTDLLRSEEFNCTGLGEPFLVQIPASPPLTRPQFERASKHWPTSFHEDKRITSALKGQLFTSNQKTEMQTYMTRAVQAARCAQELGADAVGAVIVDPRSGQIVAVGHDLRRAGNPLHHAVMACIDLVARSQGGGAYQYKNYPGCTYAALDSVSVCSSDGGGNDRPYICTGYDLYVTREPCVMCAMALVHSRISRVFYAVASADGALGTKYKIHCQKDLNHHFQVYKGVMLQACEKLMSE